MTSEQQRDALKVIFKDKLEGERWLFNGEWIYFDPLNDLNAMRAILMGLHHNKKIKIPDALELIMLGKVESPRLKIDVFYLISADPKYLAKAVLDVVSGECNCMDEDESARLEAMGWIGGLAKDSSGECNCADWGMMDHLTGCPAKR